MKKLMDDIKKEEAKVSDSIQTIKHKIYEDDQKAGKLNFKEGDLVKLRSGSGEGTLIKLDKERAEVEMGILKMWVPILELLPANKKENTLQNTRSFKTNVALHEKFDNNLDLRGYSFQEAEEFLQKFLDDALLFDAYELKIIHGVGNGVLRKLVNKKAKEYKDIKKKWHPEEDQGGEGVTMIQF
jgi:DNA mismatch repair protein MutS2